MQVMKYNIDKTIIILLLLLIKNIIIYLFYEDSLIFNISDLATSVLFHISDLVLGRYRILKSVSVFDIFSVFFYQNLFIKFEKIFF